MKTRFPDRGNQALTIVEVLIVTASLAILLTLLVGSLAKARQKAKKISCANNQDQIGLAYRIWSGDHGDKYPMEVSIANGGTAELKETSDAWRTYQVMSNELSTPYILVCPADEDHQPPAADFSAALKGKISFFIGVDADTNLLQAFLFGDDNFSVAGQSAKPGLISLTSNTPVALTVARHHFAGNIGFSDGSVQSLNNSNLRILLSQTGLATNRLVIP
jgi:competence protein ComGC